MRLAAVAGAVVALGCGGNAAGGAGATSETGLVNAARPPLGPQVVETVALDYASLPLLLPSSPRADDTVPEPAMARGTLDADPASLSNFEGTLRIGTGPVMNTPLPDGAFRAPTNPCCDGLRGCSGGPRMEWEGFAPKRRTPDALDFIKADGILDAVSCSPRAEHVSRVRAKAVVRGTLYAFRICERACDAGLGASDRREKLVVIGPQAAWIGSSAASRDQSPLGWLWSSRITVGVEPGSSATALLDVTPSSLQKFVHITGPRSPKSPVTTFAIDVVWPWHEAEPSALVTIATIATSAEQIQPPSAGYTFDE